MNMPTSVNILGAKFRVLLEAPDDPCNAGESSDCKRTIKIAPDLPVEVQVETLYHEVVHMMLKLSGVSHALTDELDEAVAQGIGFALTQFLTNNGTLPILDEVVKQ